MLLPREYCILQEVTASDPEQQSSCLSTTNSMSGRRGLLQSDACVPVLRAVVCADVVRVVSYHPAMSHPTALHVPHVTAMVLPYYQVCPCTATPPAVTASLPLLCSLLLCTLLSPSLLAMLPLHLLRRSQFTLASLLEELSEGGWSGLSSQPALWSHIGRECVRALATVHRSLHVHRDVHPNNLLFNLPVACASAALSFTDRQSGLLQLRRALPQLLAQPSVLRVVLGDFGISKLQSHMPSATDFIGTVHYACMRAHCRLTQSFGDDLQALGLVLWHLYTGQLPWLQTEDEAEVALCKAQALQDRAFPTVLAPLFDYCDQLAQQQQPGIQTALRAQHRLGPSAGSCSLTCISLSPCLAV